jgi:DNA-binding transcriptional LysR family regulator
MDTEALRTFVVIHRCGGFSAAADELGRSQPAISRRISLLEAELGGPVFERTAGGTRLSQLGETLLPHAQQVLAALEDAKAAVRELRDLEAGPISLAVVGTLAGPALTPILRRFAEQAPRATLSIRTATSSQISELVRNGQASLGVRYFEDPAPDLICHPMAPERLMVVCAPEHPLANRSAPRLADLAGERWLAFPRRDEGGERAAQTLSSQFLVRGLAEPSWTAIDSLTAQKRMVEAGFGLALLPESGVAEELKAGSLAAIEVGDLEAANPVFAIVRRGGYLSRAARTLLSFLTAAGT